LRPVAKARLSRERKQRKRKLIIVSVLLFLVGLSVTLYFFASQKNVSEGFQAFGDHYLGIMKNLNSTEVRSNMTSELHQEYNFTDLFAWEQAKLTFAVDPAGWLEDPLEILKSGRGICAQFSIVYVSACLALGYQSRLIVATNTTSWNLVHAWAEVYFNGSWVHVDPSDSVWNTPSRYQSWDWGKNIGQDIRVYAFEDGKCEDVTSRYA
jgi:hypothetical protein